MKHIPKLFFYSIAVVLIQLMFLYTGCNNPPKEEPAKDDQQTKQRAAMSKEEMEVRGEYLVNIGLCNDCHSPKIMTPEGPKADKSRLLSGSPADIKLPKINQAEISPGKWYLGSSDLTAWVGPWGVSYAANLTPDSATGSGAWSEDLFIKILRSGKFMGVDAGRPIMPPMPWEYIKMMTDEDLKCVFAYLQSLPPIKNAVHAYVPPNEIAAIYKNPPQAHL